MFIWSSAPLGYDRAAQPDKRSAVLRELFGNGERVRGDNRDDSLQLERLALHLDRINGESNRNRATPVRLTLNLNARLPPFRRKFIFFVASSNVIAAVPRKPCHRIYLRCERPGTYHRQQRKGRSSFPGCRPKRALPPDPVEAPLTDEVN